MSIFANIFQHGHLITWAENGLNAVLVLEESAQVEAIAAQFPGGTALDESLILLTKEGVTALGKLDNTASTYALQYASVKSGFVGAIAHAKANTKEHTIGRFIAEATVVIKEFLSLINPPAAATT